MSETSRSWAKGGFVLATFGMGAVALAAGGLGLAPAATFGGLGALVFGALERRVRRPGPAIFAGAALLCWAALSLVWSEFHSPDYLIRTVLGAPFYLGFVLLCLSLEGPGRRLARVGVLLAVVGAAAMFIFELVTGGAITGAFRIAEFDQTKVWRNLGHGLSGWVLLLPAALAVLPRQSMTSAALAAALVVIAVACGWGFGLTCNSLALLAALAAGGAAWLAPRATTAAVGGLTALLILAAPALGSLAAAVPEGWRAALPGSWAARLEIWSYAAGRVRERPLLGWGFDASRAESSAVEIKGQVFDALPLHPHNAGLHLWLETGAVGAVLAAALIVLIARSVARAPGLTRTQGAAAAAAAAAYVAMSQVAYGVWQEWWVAAAAWAAAAAALTGPGADGPA